VTKPLPAVDIRDVQVVKNGATFLLTDRYGDVTEGNLAALGLYHRDTRFLSRLDLRLNQQQPVLLHSSTEENHSQIIELAFPVPVGKSGGLEQRENMSLHRERILAGSLFERVRVRNFGREARHLVLDVGFAADFLDLFEVRGFTRERRGQLQAPAVERSQVVLRYVGLDGVTRTTTLRFSPMPTELRPGLASFELEVAAGAELEVAIEVIPQVGDETPPRRSLREVEARLAREDMAWRKRGTRFLSSDPTLSRFLDRSVRDLRMLQSETDDGAFVLDAGVPWYSTLFGRDAIITAYQMLTLDPSVAWAVLRTLAERQGTRDDPWREEEPGKILHEVRSGELAASGEIPHGRYYGTIDATPLWLVLLAAAYRWTADLEAARALWPHALAALRWIDEYGDRDGDGYLEYERRSTGGLENQGWKDSIDAICFPDGEPAEGPIALVEVQGYVYQAKRRLARVARDLGEDDVAERLGKEAEALRERFNRDFWVEREGYFALALDGEKRQVPTVTSNPGHCLWSQIVDPALAPRVARRLTSPALLSGWGLRTLSRKHTAYDPLGYHRGSIWPHDNAIVAHGLKRYGFDREAGMVLDQLSAAGRYFPYARFPELFCGFSSEEVPVPVQYPVACRPQAWSSGAALLMIRSYAGLTADAPRRRLFIVRPHLPRWVETVELRGLRVGDARLDLVFSSHRGVTAVQVPRKQGDVEVLIQQ